MSRLVNEFSWSVSRDRIFSSCRRAYYFRHYGSWGGWEHDTDDRTRDIYRLKKLSNRFTLAGLVVHSVVAEVLDRHRYGRETTLEAAQERALESLKEAFRESRGDASRHRKAVRLFEHEYAIPLQDTAWERMRDRVAECLTHFFASRIYRVILDTPVENWLPIDNLDSFMFEGVKIYVAPDFAFRNDLGNALVLDWKTGRQSADEDRAQIVCYGLFAWEKWKMAPRRTIGELHYLRTGEKDVVTLDETLLQAGRERIRRSIAAMRALLEDPAGNDAVEESFDRTENRDTCSLCNYRRMCWPEWPSVRSA